MATLVAPRWMTMIAYTAFTVGAVLIGIEFIQLVSSVEILDNPWSAAVAMWLLGIVLYGASKRARSTGGAEAVMKDRS